MIILGADLSYTRTGFVRLNDDFTVHKAWTITIKPGPRRMVRAMKQFQECINLCDLCVIEDQAYGAPSRIVVAKLAELQGVFKAVLEAHNIDYLLVSPGAIRKNLTGKGTATKDVVARELDRLYGIKFENDKGYDLSDAAAAACWGVAHLRKRV